MGSPDYQTEASAVAVPAADATSNASVADVVGNKEDAAQTVVGTTRSVIAYLKGLVNQIATILTRTDVATSTRAAPADIDAAVQVYAADHAGNEDVVAVVGNKSDAAQTVVGTTRSVMAYVKGIVNQIATLITRTALPAADSTANAVVADVIGNKTDAAQTTVGTTRSIMAYLKGLLNAVAALEYPDASWGIPGGNGDLTSGAGNAFGSYVTCESNVTYLKGVALYNNNATFASFLLRIATGASGSEVVKRTLHVYLGPNQGVFLQFPKPLNAGGARVAFSISDQTGAGGLVIKQRGLIGT